MHADWRDLVARDDIDVVSVTGPNFIHREVAVAAAEAGKHLWVEKPAGRNAAETRSISDAVRANGVQSAVGFNYRNVPAIEMARQLIADGRLGQINHVYIRLLADYAAHPDGALTWRFKTESVRFRRARRPGQPRCRPWSLPRGRHHRPDVPTPPPSSRSDPRWV